MKLDLSPLRKALESLERGIERSREDPEDLEVRDAVIKRFEYCYELSWKMLKRHLEQVVPNPETIDQLSFKDLIREGAERGILDRVEAWFGYREQRNISSHTYDEKKARSVYESTPTFHEDARALLRELDRRNVD